VRTFDSIIFRIELAKADSLIEALEYMIGYITQVVSQYPEHYKGKTFMQTGDMGDEFANGT
jgi:hypothetical protein